MKVLCTQMGTASALGQTMRVIAVAKALESRGHEVKVLSGEMQLSVVKDHNLDVIVLPPLPKMDFSVGFLTRANELTEDMMARMKEIFAAMSEAEQEIVKAEQPDVMVCGNITGPLTARTLNIPCAMVALQPHGQKTLEMMTGIRKKFEQMSSVISAAGLFIMEGMPELSGDAEFEVKEEERAAFRDKVRFTGPLLTEPPENLPEQGELKIRHAGNKERPLAYVTIGGGTPLIGEDFLAVVLNAFRQLPEVTGVISTGLAIDPDHLAAYNPPDNVYIRGFVPGTELIKASDITVFHGGSSTLMNCIACGTPAVVVPSIAEQEDNGAVLSQNKAGIVLDKSSLTATLLANAMNKVLGDHTFRDNAQRLKKLGDAYGGAQAAAAMVEGLINRGDTP